MHYSKIITNIEENLKNDCNIFKEIKECRNRVAHNLDFVRKEEVEQKAGIKIEKFENMVKKYIYDYKMNTKTEDITTILNIYDYLEKKILECFENEVKQIRNCSDT